MPYVTATIKVNELQAEGNARLIVEFAGDAGEPLRSRPFQVSGTSTMPQFREWVFAQLADLNTSRTVAIAAGLQVGQAVTPLAPTAPPALTAEQIWLEKARRLQRATALGLTVAQAVTDVAALRADVNATYLTAYVGKV